MNLEMMQIFTYTTMAEILLYDYNKYSQTSLK